MLVSRKCSIACTLSKAHSDLTTRISQRALNVSITEIAIAINVRECLKLGYLMNTGIKKA